MGDRDIINPKPHLDFKSVPDPPPPQESSLDYSWVTGLEATYKFLLWAFKCYLRVRHPWDQQQGLPAPQMLQHGSDLYIMSIGLSDPLLGKNSSCTHHSSDQCT